MSTKFQSTEVELSVTLLKKTIRLPLYFLTAFVLGLALTSACGLWLIVQDPQPPQIDILFTFGGERARQLYSFELMQRYPNATWVVSGPNRGVFERWLKREQFDQSRVTYLDTCSDTWSEAIAFCERIQADATAEKTLVAALVSGPYHMRRIQLYMNAAMPRAVKKQSTLRYLPVPLEWYGHDRRGYFLWWTNKRMRALVGTELKKTFGAVAGFR